MDTTENVLRAKYDEIDREIRARQRAEDSQRFLAKAVAVLGTSLDTKATIDNLGHLAISRLGDCCVVFMNESEQTVRRFTVVRDPASVSGVSGTRELLCPFDPHARIGPDRVVRTSEHELLNRVTDEVTRSLGLKSEECPLGEGTRPSSYLCVPLAARGRTIGAIAFVSNDPARGYDEDDLVLARDLACAAALALDNARLCREAQEANRLKDEFVAMVSHELRTPLTPILGCIHLLRTAKLSDANFTRALEMIERNALAQVQIVEDLLDVSRIVAGKLHLVMKSIEIVPVIEAAVDSVRPLAEAKTIQIITKFENINQPIHGDPDRIRQVIWNLLSNAVKFTPPQGQVEISAWQDGDRAHIEVVDTGIGISQDFLPYVFDRFRQADEAASKMRSGLGLGLAIVRHLVELHNGSIEATSAGVGQGAGFTLTLPMQGQKAAASTR